MDNSKRCFKLLRIRPVNLLKLFYLEKSAAAGMDNTQGDAGKDDVTAVKNNDLLHRTGIKDIVC